MNINDLETYEQLQMEAVIRGMTILEFADYYCDCVVDNKYFIFGKRIFAFNKKGKFLDCDYEFNGILRCDCCNSLTLLKGSPEVVEGGFDCSNCDNLTSLEGAPEVVNENFYCRTCKNLISLEGSPTIIKGDFYCRGCKNLLSNIEKPKGIKGNFIK